MSRTIKTEEHEIIELVVARTPETTPGGHQKLRQALSAKSTEELEQIHSVILLEATEEELLRINAERAANKTLFELQRAREREPQRKAEAERQDKQDRATFNDAARTLRSFGLNEANFSVIRSTLGPN